MDCLIERGIAVGKGCADLSVSEQEPSAIHEESAPVAGQSTERMETDSVQDTQQGEDQNVGKAMTNKQADSGETRIRQPMMLMAPVYVLPVNSTAQVCNLQQSSTAADRSLAELAPPGRTLNIYR